MALALLHQFANWNIGGVLGRLPTSRDEVADSKRPFDFLGFLMISPGIALLLYGQDHAPRREGKLFLLSGLILVCASIWHAIRKDAAALIDLRLFANRVFSVPTTTQFLSSGANYAGQMLVPLFLIAGCGISPSKAGWMLAPMGLGMMFAYPVLGRLTEKLGCRAVAAGGTIVATLGTLPFLWMTQNQLSPILLAVCLFALGAGQGAVGVPSISAAYVSVPREQLVLATTASNIVQRLGGPVGTTIIGIVLSLWATRFPAPHFSTTDPSRIYDGLYCTDRASVDPAQFSSAPPDSDT